MEQIRSAEVLRLGVVSFLNARPLIEGLDASRDVCCVADVPAALPARLDRGEVDAALIPLIDVLRGAGRYRVVSDACIGCDGETMTVRVFSQVPPNRMQTLWADPDSHTSVALARIMWRELFGRTLTLRRYQRAGPNDAAMDSVLLIGDKVVDPRRGKFAYEVDLGGAWRQHTGLPFVFAVWAQTAASVAADLPVGRPPVAADLRVGRSALETILAQARDRGVARAAEIAVTQGPRHGWPVELAQRYLTRCLKYTLDERSIAGANRFAQLCAEMDLAPAGVEIAWPDYLLRESMGGKP